MNEQHNIERIFNVIDNSLFRITGNLDYHRITDALINLANRIHEYDGDTEDIWYIGEGGECYMDELIIGAYWHYTEWHGGQWSNSYAALSALGTVFSPGMDTPEKDNPAYSALEAMAEQLQKRMTV